MPLRQFKQKIREKNSELKTLSPFRRFLFWVGILISTGVILGAFTAFVLIAVLSINLPSVTDLDNLNSALSTQIYDRNGVLLHTIHGEENREYIEYEKISQNIIEATVSIEDDEFWDHSGFDLPGITKAAMYQVFGIGKPRGGSTITQQYVKNTFLSPEQTITRKIKELILAVKIERHYDKNKIMELYLNKIPYGNNAYGIQKASQIYFDKDAKDLSIAESAILAAIPKAPTRYNPLGPNRYSHLNEPFTDEELVKRNIQSEADLDGKEFTFGLMGHYEVLGVQTETVEGKAEESTETEEEEKDRETRKQEAIANFVAPANSIYIKGRADLVLDRMEDLNYITSAEKEKARIEMQVIEFNKFRDPIKHPHFVFYVRSQLEDKYGKEIVEQGGLRVTTSIDSKIQTKAEEIIAERAKFNIENYKAENASLVSIDPQNGHILTMVGSANYFNEEIDGNVNVSTRARQPGSSFKPFAYAQAFYSGKYGPGSIIYDVPTKFGPDEPQNYDGEFEGPMSIRYALAQSRNIPAVKAYFLAGEQKPIVELVRSMGISTLDENADYGYPLALGAGESKLIEMVQAYGVFANTGKKAPLVSILKVESSNGDVLEEWKESENDVKEVLDPQVAFLINDILSDTGVRLGGNLTVDGYTNAAKTGTSTDKNKKEGGEIRPRDLWTIGYTPNLATGVWVGNNKPNEKPLAFTANGYDVAAPIWKAFMTEAVKDRPNETFEMPEGIKLVEISKFSGKIPGEQTPADAIVTEKFASFGVPDEVDNSIVEVEVDIISGMRIGEGCVRELTETRTYINHQAIEPRETWQDGITRWLANLKAKGELTGEDLNAVYGLPPEEECTAPTEEEKAKMPQVLIISPEQLESIEKTSQLPVDVDITAPFGVHKVDYYLNEKLQFTNEKAPYNGKVRIPVIAKEGSKHTIKVKVYDKKGFHSESSVEVKIRGKGEEKEEIVESEETNTTISSEKAEESTENPKPIKEVVEEFTEL